MMIVDWQRYYELEKRDYNTLTEEEKELYDYLMDKAKIIGTSAAIKLILKRSMEREK